MLEHIIQSTSFVTHPQFRGKQFIISDIEKRSLDMINNTAHNTANSTQHIPHLEEGSQEKTLGNIHPQMESIAAATKGLEYVSEEKELVDQLVELIGQSPTPELVLVDVLWKVKTIKAFDRVGHTAMEYFTDLPRKNLAKAH